MPEQNSVIAYCGSCFWEPAESSLWGDGRSRRHVTQKPIFYLIRERTGFAAGLCTLIAANLVSLLTCAAEIGGIAIILRLLVNWPYRWLILASLFFLVLMVWFLSFEWIERFFGLLGLIMIVFIAAAVALNPDWRQITVNLLVRMVCDHQLLDANYLECGKVEDLELEGGPGELKVVAILTGPGAAADRLPAWMAKFAKKLFGDQIRRAPWGEIHVITSRIKLKSKASDLKLADDRSALWLKKLPNAEWNYRNFVNWKSSGQTANILAGLSSYAARANPNMGTFDLSEL